MSFVKSIRFGWKQSLFADLWMRFISIWKILKSWEKDRDALARKPTAILHHKPRQPELSTRLPPWTLKCVSLSCFSKP